MSWLFDKVYGQISKEVAFEKYWHSQYRHVNSYRFFFHRTPRKSTFFSSIFDVPPGIPTNFTLPPGITRWYPQQGGYNIFLEKPNLKHNYYWPCRQWCQIWSTQYHQSSEDRWRQSGQPVPGWTYEADRHHRYQPRPHPRKEPNRVRWFWSTEL